MENINDEIQSILNQIKTLENKDEITNLVHHLEKLVEQQQETNYVIFNHLKEEIKRLSSL
jgi:5-formyltetrahydrofolate cyclo-ligase